MKKSFAILVVVAIAALFFYSRTIREENSVKVPYGTAVLFEYKNTSLPPSETPLPSPRPNEAPRAISTEAITDVLEEAAPCGQPESLHWLVYNRASAARLEGLFFDKLSAQGQVEWLYLQMETNSYKTFTARNSAGEIKPIGLFKCSNGDLLIAVSQ